MDMLLQRLCMHLEGIKNSSENKKGECYRIISVYSKQKNQVTSLNCLKAERRVVRQFFTESKLGLHFYFFLIRCTFDFFFFFTSSTQLPHSRQFSLNCHSIHYTCFGVGKMDAPSFFVGVTLPSSDHKNDSCTTKR